MFRIDRDGPSVLAALPPLEEANRTRAFLVTILRDLAARGFTVALPDLPGTGDSLIATQDARLEDWRAAYAEVAASLPQPVHSLAIRAGALIDVAAPVASRWRLSPQTGIALHRELMRIGQAAAREDGTPWPPPADAIAVIAGNPLHPDLLAELAAATIDAPGPIRTVRLAGDAQPADGYLDGSPLWRRAEPGNDRALAAAAATDIAEWFQS